MSFVKASSSSVVLNDSAILHKHLFDIRNPETKSEKFREGLEKIGEYLGAQVFQSLKRDPIEIKTLTNSSATHLISYETPVLVTILRAGIPLLAGVQRVFPDSEIGFLGMSRNEETLKSRTDYIAVPDMKNKTMVLVDTMLGTGGSIIDAIHQLQGHRPNKIIVVSAIASQSGVSRVRLECPQASLFVAAIDPDLNEKGYIIPGLGDAGDRAFGTTLKIF